MTGHAPSPAGSLRVGVYQCDAAGLAKAERLQRLSRHLAGRALDVVVCPELFMSGYNVGDDLGRLAEPAGGPFRAAVAGIARAAGSTVVYGYPERAHGRLYNAAQAVAPDGTSLANHRKRMNSPGSFEEDHFATGARHTDFLWRGARIAIVICYEVEFADSVRFAAERGAGLVCVPTALAAKWRPVAERMIPTRAFESGVWIAYANHGGAENGLCYLGGSRIAGPDFADAAVAGAGEAFLEAEIDLSPGAALPYARDLPKLRASLR